MKTFTLEFRFWYRVSGRNISLGSVKNLQYFQKQIYQTNNVNLLLKYFFSVNFLWGNYWSLDSFLSSCNALILWYPVEGKVHTYLHKLGHTYLKKPPTKSCRFMYVWTGFLKFVSPFITIRYHRVKTFSKQPHFNHCSESSFSSPYCFEIFESFASYQMKISSWIYFFFQMYYLSQHHTDEVLL